MEKICVALGGLQWRKQTFQKNKQINILVEEQQQVFSSELLRRSRSNTKSFIDNKKKNRGKSNNDSTVLKYSLIPATKANVTQADILKNLSLFRLQRQVLP